MPPTKPRRTLRLMEQYDSAAIYEHLHSETGQVIGFEVVIVQRTVRDIVLPGGRILPSGTPRLPSAERWGRLAWTVPSLGAARALIARRGPAGPAVAVSVPDELAA